MEEKGTMQSENRANEVSEILQSVQDLIIPYISSGDEAKQSSTAGQTVSVDLGPVKPNIVDSQSPADLYRLLSPQLPRAGQGADGLLGAARSLLQYSVNTWDAGFLDKLYATTDAPGLAAELVIAALNTNAHVYTVSPALTILEKVTGQALANLFGLTGSNAGGITVPGGTASNWTSMLIARNNAFPASKTEGMAGMSRPLTVFTSVESHYSISLAATQLGVGSKYVKAIRTTSYGAMDTEALQDAIEASIDAGEQPFYVCATAGTTVNGAYDPLPQISNICKAHGLWFHIDACWGGAAIFSQQHRSLLAGSEAADTIAFNPHKMLGVPLTCSFLLGADMRQFYFANNLAAAYLFHNEDPAPVVNGHRTEKDKARDHLHGLPRWEDVYDLAKFTPQCGRRSDGVKMYLEWQYHGSLGFARNVDAAFAAARQLATSLAKNERITLLNGNPPPCCQVCFRYSEVATLTDPIRNSQVTRHMEADLLRRGWMIDFTSGPQGEYLRVVCNRNSRPSVIDALVQAILAAGAEALDSLKSQFLD